MHCSRPCLHLPENIYCYVLSWYETFQLWLVTYIVTGLSLIRQSKGLPSQSTSVSLHSNWRIDSEYRNIYKQVLPPWFGDTLKRTLCFSQRRGDPRVVLGKRRAVGAGRWQAGASGCTSCSFVRPVRSYVLFVRTSCSFVRPVRVSWR